MIEPRLRRPVQFCRGKGCRAKVSPGGDGFCRGCRGASMRVRDLERGNRHARGYTNPWARYSAERLAAHPYCEGYPRGVHGSARILGEVTDHILAAAARPDLFWEETNHQTLCGRCNRRKAIAEEHALGIARAGDARANG